MSKKTLNAMKTLQEAFEKNKELTIPQMMTLHLLSPLLNTIRLYYIKKTLQSLPY